MIIKNNQTLILGFFGNSLRVSLTAATFRKSLLTGLLVLLLSACSGDSSDLVKYINEVKSRPGRPIEPIPKFAPLPIFRFPENDNRRNPFKPIDQKKRNDIYAPDKKRPKQPLESFPLDALKFVGTLKKTMKSGL